MKNIENVKRVLFLIVTLLLMYYTNILFYVVAFIVYIIVKKIKIENTINPFYIIVIVLVKLVSQFLKINPLILMLVLIVLFSLNYILVEIVNKEKREVYVEDKILIAKKDIMNSTEMVIIITNEKNNVVWANEKAYEEFPFLLKEQKIDIIEQIKTETKLFYDNRIYEVKRNGDIYYLTNITVKEREFKKLVNLQIIVGIIQIDNYNYLYQIIERAKFIEMDTKIKLALIDWFKQESIYYQEIADDKFQINIPYDVLQNNIENRFPKINEIVTELRNEGFDISLSTGIAYNYSNNLEIGQMAQEALELANSRGGAQIVVFDNGKRRYFGGKISSAKNNSQIRSRFVYNTIINNVNTSDEVYLMAHKRADYDAISSMLIMWNLLKEHKKEVKILIDPETKKDIYDMAYSIAPENVVTNLVVDKSKKNLLIILDTQSKDILSHPKIHDEINDCIVIDHHQTPENYIDITLFSWIEPSASSTTELILNMYSNRNLTLENKKMVKLALLAILTDTNNLKFRMNENTVNTIAFLISQGVTLLDAMEELAIEKSQFELKNQLISKVIYMNKLAYLDVEYLIEDELHSMIANELIDIKEMSASIVIVKAGEKFKIKMRSRDEVNCKVFLEEFGGGGHKRQGAAIISKNQLEELKNKIKYLNEN